MPEAAAPPGSQSSAPARPTSVTGAAFVVLGMGLFECIAVAPGAILFLLHPEMAPSATPPDTAEVVGPPMSWVLAYSLYLMAFQGLLGLISIACGIGLWLRRPWARRSSQIAMGIMVLLWLGVGTLMAISFQPPPEFGSAGAGIAIFFGAAALAVAALWASVTALPIWLLERKAARRWFEAPAA